MDLESRYELLEKIGTGSFATVYRARDRELGREVAIKQVHEQYLQDPAQLDRYWQEAQLLASLQHPNIVTIFDIYRDRGWLILELMQGSLADRLAGRQMSLTAVRTTLAHALRALKYLHSRGVVHGDVKPGNMMIDARKRVKLGDFGLARRVSDEEGSLLKGTTKYMAPEVVSDEFGEVGPASDLYALGFVAYELMCGENFESLFPGLSAFGRNKQVAWMMWHAAADRRLPPIHRVLEGVPEDLARVVERMIEKDQSQRYRSADQALADLKVDLRPSRSEGSSADVEQDEPSDDPDRRKRVLLLGGAFAFSLVMSLMLLFLPGNGTTGESEPESSVWIVSEVFAEEHSLKVEHPERAEARELAVGASPRILLKGRNQSLLLRELEPGDRIEVRELRERGRPVTELLVSRPVVSRGRLQRIDRRDGSIVLSVDEGDTRETLRLRVGDRTDLDVNARAANLYDLEEGDRAEVQHLEDFGGRAGRVAARVSIRRREEKVGFVLATHPAREPPRLEVRFGRGSPEPPLSLPVAKDCRFAEHEGGALLLADLQLDDRVRVQHDTEFREVIVTPGRHARGVALQIGPQDGNLLLRTDDGMELAFDVGPDCEITLGMGPAELADLRERRDSLEVTWNDSGDAGGRPAARAIFATRGVSYDRCGLVIGVERYADRNLAPLERTVADARLIHETLRHRYGVPEDRLRLLIDPSKRSMQDQLTKFLAEAGSRTQVILYVAAHADTADDGRAYLAGRDFDLDRAAETGLSLDWFLEQIEGCPARDKLLLFDGSHPGSGRELERQPFAADLLERLTVPLRTTHVIAASSSGERSRDWIPGRRGAFAHFVAEGLGGRADRERDLHVSPEELFGYLSEKLASQPLTGGSQTPLLLSPQ